MKINIEKINRVFENNVFSDDVTDLIFYIFDNIFINQKISDDSYLLGLDYRKIEEDEEEDCIIIDFYKLDKLESKFRNFLIERIKSQITMQNYSMTFDRFLFDSGICLEYKDWKKLKRKHKLEALDSKN